MSESNIEWPEQMYKQIDTYKYVCMPSTMMVGMVLVLDGGKCCLT